MKNRVAFSIWGIDIMWYAILLTGAALLGVWVALRNAKKEGFQEDDVIDSALWALPLGIVGARLYYVLFSLDYYQGDWLAMLNIRQGGLAIHGGLIAGALAIYVFAKRRQLHFWKFADLFAISLPLAQAIGRWGNFINGEAHGGPTDLPWGILVNGVKVHPTFFYESFGDFLIFLLLSWLRPRKKFDGQLIGLYLVGYSALRFLVESLRTDSLMFLGLRQAQLISLVLLAAGVCLLYARRAKGKAPAYKKEG